MEREATCERRDAVLAQEDTSNVGHNVHLNHVSLSMYSTRDRDIISSSSLELFILKPEKSKVNSVEFSKSFPILSQHDRGRNEHATDRGAESCVDLCQVRTLFLS